MDATLRLDQIRRLLTRDSVETIRIVEAVAQLCERSSDAAISLRFLAMQRLHTTLRVDNHPLLRKQARSLRQQDIPANGHLVTLRRVTELVFDELKSRRTNTDAQIKLLGARLEEQKIKLKQLESELADYIDTLTEDKADSVWSSSSSLSNARREFIAQVTNLAKTQWPKRTELDKVSQGIIDLVVRSIKVITY